MMNDIKKTAEAIQNGDQEAFREFFDAYFAKIYGFLLTILKNEADAEDVTSVAFIYVWNNRAKLRKQEQLVSWLYQVAKHRALDLLRKRSSGAMSSLDGLEEVLRGDQPAPEEEVQKFYNRKLVLDILSDLNAKERALIHLRFTEDLTYSQISQRLGLNSVAVRVRMHRIIKRLKQKIHDEQLRPDGGATKLANWYD